MNNKQMARISLSLSRSSVLSFLPALISKIAAFAALIWISNSVTYQNAKRRRTLLPATEQQGNK